MLHRIAIVFQWNPNSFCSCNVPVHLQKYAAACDQLLRNKPRWLADSPSSCGAKRKALSYDFYPYSLESSKTWARHKPKPELYCRFLNRQMLAFLIVIKRFCQPSAMAWSNCSVVGRFNKYQNSSGTQLPVLLREQDLRRLWIAAVRCRR